MDRKAFLKGRIVFYRFFSSIYTFNLEYNSYSAIVQDLDILRKNPINDASAHALDSMSDFLQAAGFTGLKDESDKVFFDPATAFLPMTASYYHEKRDDGSKRLEMLLYVLASQYRKNSEKFRENEDHIEFVLQFMMILIHDEYLGDKKAAALSATIFEKIINQMIDPFSQELYHHPMSVFYKNSAVALYSFISAERLFLGIEANHQQRGKEYSKARLRKEKKAPREMVQRNFEEFGCV